MATRAVYPRRRTFDVVIPLVVGVLGAPFIVLLGLTIRVKLGRPILFRQSRAGLHGVPFVLVKFRTMIDARDEWGRRLPDEERLTSFGRWLRSTSLDELPEFWNVLSGDMAMVGPRPLPVSYLPRYTKEEARRHEVRPGVTGWAQVHGRNSTTWEERLAMDVWYVDHRSLWLDIRILAATVRTVLQREGVSADDHVTMYELRPEVGAD